MRYKKPLASKEKTWKPHGPMLDADFSGALGTEKIAVHWVQLRPNQRSSTPHVESHEEGFVYIVSGHPHV